MSKIEWTGQTWNPIVGCSVVSPGCTNCYAMKVAGVRLDGNPKTPHYSGTTQPSKAGPVWTGKVAKAPERTLLAPLRRRKPTTYFVNSMGDLFHENVPDEWIEDVFQVMRKAPQHTFQVLTKRADRMHDYMVDYLMEGPVPLNVWLGVSVEDRDHGDERVPALIDTPAAVRFLSCEPLLAEIDLSLLMPKIDWLICGGESGPNARPMHPDWARSLRDQCKAAGVPFFMKQMAKKATIPADLMIREFPQ